MIQTTSTLPGSNSGMASQSFWQSLKNYFSSVPKTTGFLLGNFPLALIAFCLSSVLIILGIGTSIIYLGLPILSFALVLSNWIGSIWRSWVGTAYGESIIAPEIQPAEANKSWLVQIMAPLKNYSSWLAALFNFFIVLPITLITWSISLVWFVLAAGGTTFWLWNLFVPNSPENLKLHQLLWQQWTGELPQINPHLGESIVMLLIGLFTLITLPGLFKIFTALHWQLAKVFLGASEAQLMRQKVSKLEQSHQAVLTAEGRTLAQLERDLHDGPQQHLVRMQMDLDLLSRKIESDPEAAQQLLAEAKSRAQDTLEEVRALSRGFAPPILAERGLAAALESLAVNSTIEVELNLALSGQKLHPAIERAVYFAAAELLTNIAKHAKATSLKLELSENFANQKLVLTVSDNGVGGAKLKTSGGLSGLNQRLEALNSSLEIDSPDGGPTKITANLPLELMS